MALPSEACLCDRLTMLMISDLVYFLVAGCEMRFFLREAINELTRLRSVTDRESISAVSSAVVIYTL